MKILTHKNIKLSDVFYFIKTDTGKFKVIEMINEFGIESKEKYVEYIKDKINVTNDKKYTIVLISMYFSNKNYKLKKLEFNTIMKEIGITDYDVLEKTENYNKEVYCLRINENLSSDALKRLFNYENTIIFSQEDVYSQLHIETVDSYNYQVDFEKLISKLKSKFLLISNYKTSDDVTYFIIEN